MRNFTKGLDFFLLIPVLILTFFGLFMIYDASSFVAFRDFGDKYHYLKEQSVWVVLGLGALFFGSVFDYKKYYNLALPILIVCLALLLLVFVPGLGLHVLGARRWIDLGFFVIQPTEMAKIGLSIYFAAWFSAKEEGRFPAFLLLLGFVTFLIMLQPDLGTAFIILSMGMSIYFLSGGSLISIFSIIPVLFLALIALIKLEPYRAARLTTFLNPDANLQTSSYHVRQILIALGSGGITGVGLGNSLQKFAYLPESTTDSIFAIIAEEIGLIGGVIIISIFLFIALRGFKIALSTSDNFGRLLASGIITYLSVQVLVNLGSQTALLPLTGVPLPFISYGGSALIMSLFGVGVLLNIGRRSKV